MKRVYLIILFITSLFQVQAQPVWYPMLYTGYVHDTTVKDNTPGPLDTTASAAVLAYSFRHLKSSYQGPIVRLLNTFNMNEEDFYSYNGYLDTLTVKTFCKNNCTIVKWYDQSGNGHHAVQPTASIQPFLHNEKGRWYLDHNVRRYMQVTDSISFTNYSVFLVGLPLYTNAHWTTFCDTNLLFHYLVEKEASFNLWYASRPPHVAYKTNTGYAFGVDTAFQMASLVDTGGAIYINRTLAASTYVTTEVVPVFAIKYYGIANGSYTEGGDYEVILYTNKVSSTDRDIWFNSNKSFYRLP